MAGAVGSSSMAGMAASVNKDLRVRVVKRSGAISQRMVVGGVAVKR